MTKYQYNGNIPWVASLRYQKDGKWTVMDVNMSKGDQQDLPDETASVKWMVASGSLTAVNVNPKPTTEIK